MKQVVLGLAILFSACQLYAYQGLDTTFGKKGIVKWSPGFSFPGSMAKLLPGLYQKNQPEKFYGICTLNGQTQLFIQKLLPNLSPDSSVGPDGLVYYPIQIPANLRFTGRDYLGNIIFAGTDTLQSKKVISIFRYTPDFKPDTNFGLQGKVLRSLGILDEDPSDLSIQPDGKLLLSLIDQISKNPKVIRLNQSGELDSSFSGNGIFEYPSLEQLHVKQVALFPNGKILLSLSHNNSKTALIKLQANGILDSSFGVNGIKFLNIGTGSEYILSLWPNQFEEINVLGLAQFNSTSTQMLFMQLTSVGNTKQSFGNFGICLLGPNSGSYTVHSYADSNFIWLQTGKILYQIGGNGNLFSKTVLQADAKLCLLANNWIQLSSKSYPEITGILRTAYFENFMVNTSLNVHNEYFPGNTMGFKPVSSKLDYRNGRFLFAIRTKTNLSEFLKILILDSIANTDSTFEKNASNYFSIKSSKFHFSIKWQSDTSFFLAIQDSLNLSVFRYHTNGQLLANFNYLLKNSTKENLQILPYSNDGRFIIAYEGISRYLENGQVDSTFNFNFAGNIQSLSFGKNKLLLIGSDTSFCMLNKNGIVETNFGNKGHFSNGIMGRNKWEYFRCIGVQESTDGSSYLLNFTGTYQASLSSFNKVNRIIRLDLTGKSAQILYNNIGPGEQDLEYNLLATANQGFLLAEKSTYPNAAHKLLLFSNWKPDTAFAIETWSTPAIGPSLHQLFPHSTSKTMSIKLSGNQFEISRFSINAFQAPILFPTAIIANKTILGYGDSVSLRPDFTNLNATYSWEIQPPNYKFKNQTNANSPTCWIELLQNGPYTIRLKVIQQGDSSLIQQKDYIHKIPQLDFTSTQISPGVNVVFQLNAQANGAIKGYSWEISPNKLRYLNGTDSTSKNPNLVLTEPGWYKVGLTIHYPDTIINLTKDKFLYAIPAGIESEPKSLEIACWPNPTQEKISIQLPLGLRFRKLILVDTYGKQYSPNWTENSGLLFLDIPGSTGVYTLLFEGANKEIKPLKLLKI